MQIPRRADSLRAPHYRRHKPSGQAVVILSGTDYYLGRHDTKASRQEYDRLICEWLACGRSLPNQAQAGPNMARLCVAHRGKTAQFNKLFKSAPRLEKPCLFVTLQLSGSRIRKNSDVVQFHAKGSEFLRIRLQIDVYQSAEVLRLFYYLPISSRSTLRITGSWQLR